MDERIRAVIWSLIPQLITPLALARPGLVAVDLGAGEGNDVRPLRRTLGAAARLVAVDLRTGALGALRHSGAPVELVAASAARLPFREGSVDLVLQSTMLSSVLSADRREQIYAEIRRVMARGGLFLSLDMRLPNPRNPNVTPIVKGELRRAFPGWEQGARSIILAPPVHRALLAVSPRLARAAEVIPFLRSHLMFWARRLEG